MTDERLYTLHYFAPDPNEPQYCLHCDARPDDPTEHPQEEDEDHNTGASVLAEGTE